MRLNFEVNEEKMASFKELQRRTGAGTMKDLVNHAISMLEWAVGEAAKGNEIAAVNEKNESYRILVTPLLQYAAKHRELVEEPELVPSRLVQEPELVLSR